MSGPEISFEAMFCYRLYTKSCHRAQINLTGFLDHHVVEDLPLVSSGPVNLILKVVAWSSL